MIKIYEFLITFKLESHQSIEHATDKTVGNFDLEKTPNHRQFRETPFLNNSNLSLRVYVYGLNIYVIRPLGTLFVALLMWTLIRVLVSTKYYFH